MCTATKHRPKVVRRMLQLLCWVGTTPFLLSQADMRTLPARNNDLNGVVSSLKQMEDRFNKKFQYPYVFLNDRPFDAAFKKYAFRYVHWLGLLTHAVQARL